MGEVPATNTLKTTVAKSDNSFTEGPSLIKFEQWHVIGRCVVLDNFVEFIVKDTEILNVAIDSMSRATMEVGA